MKKIMQMLLTFMVYALVISCSSQLNISNGAFSDLSLVRSSENYTVKRLKEVKETGKTVFGIPCNPANTKQGLIYRFNGINLNNTNGFLPILSMIAITLPTGILINQLVGKTPEYTDRLGLILSTALAIPISGAINNYIWTGSAYKTAAFNLNSRLLEENPDVDVFLNPKYKIENKINFWSQTATISAKVMGATINVDEDMTNTTIKKDETCIKKNPKNEAVSNTFLPSINADTKDRKSTIGTPTKSKNDGIKTISYPLNSILLIDNKRIQQNPHSIILTNGSHKLGLMRNNYKVEQNINISDSSNFTLLTLSFTSDSLSVIDNLKGRAITIHYPNESQLYIDHILVNDDNTPYKGVLTLGVHNIKILENGKVLIQKDITILESDTDLSLNFSVD